MESVVWALMVIGATFALTGLYLYRRGPVVLRSDFYRLPFSVIYLVALFHPFLFGHAPANAETVPPRSVLFFLWVLIQLVWDPMFGDLHVVNVDRYGAYDAVTESLRAAKMQSSFEPSGEGLVRVGKFEVPVLEATIRVTYVAPLRYAVLRFHQHGVRGFDRGMAMMIRKAVSGKPSGGQTSFAAIWVFVGAILVLLAFGLATG